MIRIEQTCAMLLERGDVMVDFGPNEPASLSVGQAGGGPLFQYAELQAVQTTFNAADANYETEITYVQATLPATSVSSSQTLTLSALALVRVLDGDLKGLLDRLS